MATRPRWQQLSSRSVPKNSPVASSSLGDAIGDSSKRSSLPQAVTRRLKLAPGTRPTGRLPSSSLVIWPPETSSEARVRSSSAPVRRRWSSGRRPAWHISGRRPSRQRKRLTAAIIPAAANRGPTANTTSLAGWKRPPPRRRPCPKHRDDQGQSFVGVHQIEEVTPDVLAGVADGIHFGEGDIGNGHGHQSAAGFRRRWPVPGDSAWQRPRPAPAKRSPPGLRRRWQWCAKCRGSPRRACPTGTGVEIQDALHVGASLVSSLALSLMTVLAQRNTDDAVEIVRDHALAAGQLAVSSVSVTRNSEALLAASRRTSARGAVIGDAFAALIAARGQAKFAIGPRGGRQIRARRG